MKPRFAQMGEAGVVGIGKCQARQLDLGSAAPRIGGVVSFWTRVNRIGTTSISRHVLVEAERAGQVVRLTEAKVVYVAIDDKEGDRRPLPIRPVETHDL